MRHMSRPGHLLLMVLSPSSCRLGSYVLMSAVYTQMSHAGMHPNNIQLSVWVSSGMMLAVY